MTRLRIGIVNFLNARPLDYGIRRLGENEIVEAPPSYLYQRLLNNELDCALISSVECLRHKKQLDWCKTVGVCSHGMTRSVIYIKRKNNASPAREAKISKLWCDSNSRTSISLWECLYKKHYHLPKTELLPFSKVVSRDLFAITDTTFNGHMTFPDLDCIRSNEGGVLIGDNALAFYQSVFADQFIVYDLGQWWNDREELPFVYALWAYPHQYKIPDDFFEISLKEGLKNIKQIVEASPFSNTNEYLNKNIHYHLKQAEFEALQKFESYILK